MKKGGLDSLLNRNKKNPSNPVEEKKKKRADNLIK